MSGQKPSLWGVLSDTSRIIRSNSLHFATLSLLFIFPIPVFNIIHTLTQPPSPSPSPFNSHYSRLLSPVDSTYQGQIPSFDKFQPLYALALLIVNIFSVSSFIHSVFHSFHKTPIKLSSSLKSILSSFLPLLATKLAYTLILVAIVFGFGICIGAVLLGMLALGLETNATSKSFMAVVLVAMVALVVLVTYLGVKWCLIDAIVVVESKYGFAPFERSSGLVKGMRRVAFFMITLLAVLQGIMSGWLSVLGGVARAAGGCSGGVAVQMLAYAVVSTAVSLFGFAATTVLFIHCKALNGESEIRDKLGEVYTQLSVDDVVEKV